MGGAADSRYDVVIVGAGPAGLNAALLLGRCCRRVMLFDGGRPRNDRSPVHGFLSRDGTEPGELRRIGRAQLAPYTTVEVRDMDVVDAATTPEGFLVTPAEGPVVRARKLLLATGVVDDLPPIPGLAELWGRFVFPCPYCDAWEFRGRPLGVLGDGESAVALCRALLTWSRDVVLFANGGPGIPREEEQALVVNGVGLSPGRVRALEGTGPGVRVILDGGTTVARAAIFVSTGRHQRSPLVERLGCRLDETGAAATGLYETTNVRGLYVAGDASRNVQFAIVAAAEGAQAAFAINRALVREEFSSRLEASRRADRG